MSSLAAHIRKIWTRIVYKLHYLRGPRFYWITYHVIAKGGYAGYGDIGFALQKGMFPSKSFILQRISENWLEKGYALSGISLLSVQELSKWDWLFLNHVKDEDLRSPENKSRNDIQATPCDLPDDAKH